MKQYNDQEDALKVLFTKLCPENNDLRFVLLKTTALNRLSGTNIFDIYSVSNHIYVSDIDEDLNSGKGDLINEIASVEIGGKSRNNYSFATKYYSYHKPNVYSIYDHHVSEMLWHFRNMYQFAEFKRYELKTYKIFSDVIKKFQMFYKLTGFSLREIDTYLWLAGKEYFPKTR